DLDRALVGLLDTHDHAEQRGLARAVGADHADDAAARQLERQVIDQQSIAESLAHSVEHHDLVAEPLPGRDHDLERGIARFLLRLGHHLVVPSEASLALGLARLGRAAHPLELALEHALAGAGLLLLVAQPLRLELEPARVIALERMPLAAIELEDP